MRNGNIQGRERGLGGLNWRLITPVVLLDLGARLAGPVAVLALARAAGNAALVSAATVAVLAAVRAVVSGLLRESAERRLWHRVINATCRRSVPDLRARSDDHGSVALINATHLVASLQGSLLPRMIASVVALLAVVLAALLLLGTGWIVLGAIALLLGASTVMVAHRHMRRAQRLSYRHFTHGAHDFEVLADAAMELRAHGREARHAKALFEVVGRMAREQRRVTTYSALAGLFPLGIALLVATAPFAVGGSSFVDTLGSDVVDAGVLGVTGLFLGLDLAQAVGSWTVSAPQRAALTRYLVEAQNEQVGGTRAVDLQSDVIELREVSVVYANAEVATPSRVSLRWPPGVGVAVTGANGAGKSTLSLCLLGLIEPTDGDISIGEVPISEIDWRRVRQHLVYLPQEAYFADDRSVAWHLRLLLHGEVGDAALESALSQVGLWPVLRERVRKSGGSPFDVPASQLSGGERKRLQLARAHLGHPHLIVLDEPEAGLDEASRQWLRQYLAELATATRVMVIAHDPTVIPSTFERVECQASSIKPRSSS